MTEHNHLLGKFDLTGIREAQRGVPQVEVTFEIDSDGILSVSAKESSSGAEKDITINNDSGRLSREEIEEKLKEAEKFAEEDKIQKEKSDAKRELDNYIHEMRS
eukprot:CAMPEP_0204821164 /NCGR_PEP_ID=MMETSP1018-20131115/4149_1 /ASSEMBLY_ACC=CAM_ASM_000518 /TAXON_ID=46462 /ORGANISM="Anophryoides haemophila, Strain AH6" /LENGTH=103 /DNA_ID=CAMNT_0051921517 /DNA_START=1377 /DNA_END=1688 /DNA_ORIENTATION=-